MIPEDQNWYKIFFSSVGRVVIVPGHTETEVLRAGGCACRAAVAGAGFAGQVVVDMTDLRDILTVVEEPSVAVRRTRSREVQLVVVFAAVRRNPMITASHMLLLAFVFKQSLFGAWLLVGARLTTSACPGRCGVSHTSRTWCSIFSCWQVLSPSLVGSRAPAISSPVLVHWPPSGASVVTCWRMVRGAASRQLPRSDWPPGCLRSFPSSFIF